VAVGVDTSLSPSNDVISVTGTLTKTGPSGNWDINGQELPSGTVVPCSTSMSIWN
jgi:hypothetical protein